MTRGLFTVLFTSPKLLVAPISCMLPALPFPVSQNCGWLNKLKNSARNWRLMPSRKGSPMFLTAEKSVFTKRGPFTGVREVDASVPSVAGSAFVLTKAQGLNQFCRVWTCAGQSVRPPMLPPLFGSPTSIGRLNPAPPFQKKGTPDWLLLSMRKRGNPEIALSITFTDQPPKMALVAPFQLPPYFLPLPKGRS